MWIISVSVTNSVVGFIRLYVIFITHIVEQDTERAIARARKDFLIRHHLDRTTGVGKCIKINSQTW